MPLGACWPETASNGKKRSVSWLCSPETLLFLYFYPPLGAIAPSEDQHAVAKAEEPVPGFYGLPVGI